MDPNSEPYPKKAYNRKLVSINRACQEDTPHHIWTTLQFMEKVTNHNITQGILQEGQKHKLLKVQIRAPEVKIHNYLFGWVYIALLPGAFFTRLHNFSISKELLLYFSCRYFGNMNRNTHNNILEFSAKSSLLQLKDGSSVTCHPYGISTLMFIYNRQKELSKIHDMDYIAVAHIENTRIKQCGQSVDPLDKIYRLEKDNPIWKGKKVHVFMNMTVPYEYIMPQPLGLNDFIESNIKEKIPVYTWTQIQNLIQRKQLETVSLNRACQEDTPHHIWTTLQFLEKVKNDLPPSNTLIIVPADVDKTSAWQGFLKQDPAKTFGLGITEDNCIIASNITQGILQEGQKPKLLKVQLI